MLLILAVALKGGDNHCLGVKACMPERHKSVLVVDPDSPLGEFLALLLRKEGYETTLAQSLDKAITLLSVQAFDLIITEAFKQTNLFHFDPAFLDTFRERAPNIPIILCSVWASTDNLRKGNYGLAEVIPKPFDVDALLKKVSEVFGQSRVDMIE